MARPNNFILNTDYLSIAQFGKYTHTYVVNGGTLPAGGQLIQHNDFNVPFQKGAIDRIFISVNGGDLRLGSIFNAGYKSSIQVYRTSPNTLRAEFVVNNIFESEPVSWPMLSFTIKGMMFKPPNVF